VHVPGDNLWGDAGKARMHAFGTHALTHARPWPQLEEELARFMGTDEAIIYSYDIATVSSIIPAFANRKDVLIIDEVRGGQAWLEPPDK